MPVVLGWGCPVLDDSPIQATAALYKRLAAEDNLVLLLSQNQNLRKHHGNGWVFALLV
jgi:hypothetical protein